MPSGNGAASGSQLLLALHWAGLQRLSDNQQRSRRRNAAKWIGPSISRCIIRNRNRRSRSGESKQGEHGINMQKGAPPQIKEVDSRT
jgi:hypothetical protein